ncbi:hypothetical protein CPB85DRAFT_1399531 [Mucidula mucida]|nr:hypothetical protein CPB85DRAFT_1399531 [Mucidula mucida]
MNGRQKGVKPSFSLLRTVCPRSSFAPIIAATHMTRGGYNQGGYMSLTSIGAYEQTMAPVQIPGVENLSLITGPYVLGYMWSYCLYGVLIVQVYMYSQQFPNDRRALKILVWSLFFLETLFTVFMTIAACKTFGSGWGDVNAILVFDWSWSPLPALSSFMGGMAQSFYAWRIYRMTKSIWLVGLIELVMLMQLTATFHFDIAYFSGSRLVLELYQFSDEITIWLAGSATCDLIITVSLVFLLHKRKPASHGIASGFLSTTDLVNKLIRFNMETGMITCLGAITELALFLSTHQYNFHLILFLMLGKLYSNTLMATLNYRDPMRQAHDVVVHAQSAFWADEDVNRRPKFKMPDRRLDVTCTTEMTTTVADSMMLQVDAAMT